MLTPIEVGRLKLRWNVDTRLKAVFISACCIGEASEVVLYLLKVSHISFRFRFRFYYLLYTLLYMSNNWSLI